MALCNLIRHDYPLPKMYQNFDYISNVKEGEEEYYGGSVTLADFCPFIQEFTWRSKNIIVRGSQCQFEENNPSKFSRINQGLFVLIQRNQNIFIFEFQQNRRKTSLSNHMEIIRNVLITRIQCGRRGIVDKLENGSIGVLVATNIVAKIADFIFW